MALHTLRQWFGRQEQPATTNETGDAETQFRAAVMWACGEGESQDYSQAVQCYTRAAEGGHALAQYNLAMMYAQGQGVLRDRSKSLMWLTRAAELGDAGAQYKLGLEQHFHRQDEGVETTAEGRIEALKWVSLSAAQGYHQAQSACEFVALTMSWEEVAEATRRADVFLAGKPGTA